MEAKTKTKVEQNGMEFFWNGVFLGIIIGIIIFTVVLGVLGKLEVHF